MHLSEIIRIIHCIICKKHCFVFLFSPYHLPEHSAHQSHCGRRATAGGRGFQIEKHETQTETWQIIWQHRENGIDTQRARISLLDFLIIKGIKTAMLTSTSNQCVHHVTLNLYNTSESNTKQV